jgi:16S rRNA (adenine1518-N6/adenine1519-N6)-dimethyltransferase
MTLMSEHIPKKSLGQHWLYDDVALDGIVAEADLGPNDTVVEVGPGLGTLTERLLETGANVIAVEFDESLLGGLRAKFDAHPNFALLHQDILQFDFSALPQYKIVANIPYYLTSQLLRIIGDNSSKPQVAVLLVQKEVAQRVCAQPPDMSILAVAVQLEFTANLGDMVPAKLFVPAPKVDSQVLILHKRSQDLFGPVNKKHFMRVVKAGFSAKRKTLRNTLSAGLALTKPQAELLLQQAGIDMGLRAEALSLQQWHQLYQLYKA